MSYLKELSLDVELLKEIRKDWTDFSNIIFAINKMANCRETNFTNIKPGKDPPDNPIFLSVKIVDMATWEKMIKPLDFFRGSNIKRRFTVCLINIRKILHHERFDPFRRKIIGDNLRFFEQLVTWFSKNERGLLELLINTDAINKAFKKNPEMPFDKKYGILKKQEKSFKAIDFDSYARMLKSLYPLDQEAFSYEKGDYGISSTLPPNTDMYFIYEIDAIIKSYLMDIKQYELAKDVCIRKRIDIYSPGLLIHKENLWWSPSKIVRFIREGMKSERGIEFNPDYIFAGQVCFFILGNYSQAKAAYMAGAQGNRDITNYPLAFIIDPKFVRENSNFFVYNDSNPEGSSTTYSDNYFELVKRAGFIETKMKHKIANEVRSRGPIPFSAICGMVLVNGNYKDRVTYFMLRLIKKDPALVFPVYDIKGKVIWPN